MEEDRLYDLYALDEDIKILETQILACKECKFATCEQCEISWKEVQSIEHLIKAYRKLEEKNRKLDEKFKYAVPDNIVEENYIPKSKIKEKIEELEKEKNTVIEEINFKAFYRITDLKNVEISVLQEFLEEE